MKPMYAAVLLAATSMPGLAQPSASPAPDYSHDDTWLCRSGRADACAADQSATVIQANGTRTIERFVPAAVPKFDCFYVYPTVSRDPTPNSDMNAGPEEREVAAFQAARFAKYCRVFAPIYRQVTLTALRGIMAGNAVPVDRQMAYDDVKAAWDAYLTRDNHGRGVVLIGHSQGSGLLKMLMQREIDGKPVQRQLISAMLMGTNVAVPQGRDIGGDLKSIPLCHASDQTGCLVTYVTFRASAPPPDNSRFGSVPQPGMVAACVNPAGFGRGDGPAMTDNYMGAKGAGLASAAQPAWTADGAPVTTPFVKAPGLISAQCAASGKFRYLAVTVNADPAGARTNTIVGDVTIGKTVLKDWGLHLIDMPVEMGNLVELSNTQARAWLAGRK